MIVADLVIDSAKHFLLILRIMDRAIVAPSGGVSPHFPH
jgi:hypothetical protein